MEKAKHKQVHINVELLKQRMKDLGLNAYRIHQNTSNKELYATKLTQMYVGRLISGEVENPTMKKIKTICDVFEVRYDELIIDKS